MLRVLVASLEDGERTTLRVRSSAKGKTMQNPRTCSSNCIHSGHFVFSVFSITSTNHLYRLYAPAILSIHANYVACHPLAIRDREREGESSSTHAWNCVYLSKIGNSSYILDK